MNELVENPVECEEIVKLPFEVYYFSLSGKFLIKDLAQQEIGILITDHNVRETLGICTRAYIMNQGSVITSGTPQQILENKDVKKFYLGDDFRM